MNRHGGDEAGPRSGFPEFAIPLIRAARASRVLKSSAGSSVPLPNPVSNSGRQAGQSDSEPFQDRFLAGPAAEERQRLDSSGIAANSACSAAVKKRRHDPVGFARRA